MKNVAFIVATGLVAAAACATPLPPSGSVSPLPVNGATVNGSTIVQPWTPSAFASGNFSGTLYSIVITNVVGNPNGLSAYSFLYYVENSVNSTDDIGRFTVNGFTGYNCDVGTDPAAVGGGFVECFENNRSADGFTLGWSFLDLSPAFDQVSPGQRSNYFVVHTDATSAFWSDASVIDGSIASAHAWAPLPTPGAGALLGLGTLAAFRRRR